MSVRFDLDKPEERRAWEYLRSISGSKNKAVIDALCTCTDGLTLSDVVRSTIRECLQDTAIPVPAIAQPAAEISEEESDLLDSLDAFLG